MNLSRPILVVDDDAQFLEQFLEILAKVIPGQALLAARSAEEALRMMQEKAVSVVISDQRMAGLSGTDFLSQVAERYPTVVRILITGYSDLSPAIEAINKAAVKFYISKAEIMKDPRPLKKLLEEALDHSVTLEQLEEVRKQRAGAPADLANLKITKVGVVTSHTNDLRNFAMFSTVFQMPITTITPQEFCKTDKMLAYHVLFIDVDDVLPGDIPAALASKAYPRLIALSASPAGLMAHRDKRVYYDVVSWATVRDLDKLTLYLYQLPAIGTALFIKESDHGQ